MAKSTGYVLTATGIAFMNELVQGDFNIRIPVAGGLFALFDAGIEKINEEFAVGLGVLMVIAALTTPFRGKAPLENLASLTEHASTVPAKIPSATFAPQGIHSPIH